VTLASPARAQWIMPIPPTMNLLRRSGCVIRELIDLCDSCVTKTIRLERHRLNRNQLDSNPRVHKLRDSSLWRLNFYGGA